MLSIKQLGSYKYIFTLEATVFNCLANTAFIPINMSCIDMPIADFECPFYAVVCFISILQLPAAQAQLRYFSPVVKPNVWYRHSFYSITGNCKFCVRLLPC